MAEDKLNKKAAGSTSEALGIESTMGLGDLSKVEILKLFHESQVYQIELEMQNEELLRAKEQAEFEAEKYLELYDSSPSGYFTLSREGKIVELNLTGAQMLGKERAKLKNSKFGFFVSPGSISFFNIFVERVFTSHVKESCEIILSINKELPIDVYLTGLVKADGEHCFVTMVDISERKRAERELISVNEELSFQRDRLQKITSLVPGVVYQYRLRRDGSSYFPYSSEVIQSMYRVTPDEIARDASAIFEKLHPDDRKGFVASVEKSAKDLTTWQREFRVQFDDGTMRIHSAKGLPQLEEDGSVLWHGLITDITASKQTEEELQKSNELLSLFMNHSPIFAFIKEVSQTESRTLKASENYRDMIGISGSEMAGKTMYELFPAELAASITADDWKVASEEKQLEIEETFNGRIYSSIKFPITLGGKKLLAGYSIDITERRRLEYELQESERHYRILVETSPDGIMIVQGASFMFVNQPMAEITGYSIEELMMMPNMEMVYSEDRDLVENNYRKRQKGEGADPKYHFRIVKKDGSLAWIELNGRKTEWKGETAVLQFVRDITERIEAEKEILQKNADLQKLNAEKDKFFSIISHDLRSPFQALLGYYPLTMERIKTYPLEKVQLLLFDMRTSAEKLFDLLENLLEWSKMQRGLTSFHPSAIRLQEVIAEIVKIIRNSADKKMIEISCDIPEHLAVNADKRMFDSIINNLVFNAVKFTHKQGQVTISAMAMPDNLVEISIKDKGIGMNKEMIDSLFRLDADVSHKGTEGEPSSGIGLFICKDFVEKHGGKIWAESEEGKGSTFRFTLPV
jgi:PAS domain S-box-containing protein